MDKRSGDGDVVVIGRTRQGSLPDSVRVRQMRVVAPSRHAHWLPGTKPRAGARGRGQRWNSEVCTEVMQGFHGDSHYCVKVFSSWSGYLIEDLIEYLVDMSCPKHQRVI